MITSITDVTAQCSIRIIVIDTENGLYQINMTSEIHRHRDMAPLTRYELIALHQTLSKMLQIHGTGGSTRDPQLYNKVAPNAD